MAIDKITVREYYEENILYNKLIEDFNKIAREMKSKYYMNLDRLLPGLHKNIFLWFGDSLGENVILYNKNTGQFYFYEGIDEDIAKEIKPILEKLKQNFLIEVT